MRNENGKFEPEKTLLNGSWYNLKADFKNRDFFQDIMIQLHGDLPKNYRSDIPKYPMSCIIDYCGFRVLCESDIYIEDGGATCMNKRFDMFKEEIPYYKDIISVDK